MSIMITVAQALKQSLQESAPATVVTVISGPGLGKKAVISATGDILVGELPEGFPKDNCPLKTVFAVGEQEFFAQNAEKDPEVLILGAGHVSRCISELLEFIGCDVTVVDDRAEYLRPDFFSPSVTRVCLDFHELETLPLAQYSGIIIVTRAHEFDGICLRQIRPYLDTYVGIMGSKNRVGHVRNALRNDGWSEAELDAIYGPIGLRLGAETPEEIALSIVSEYLSVIRGKWPVSALKFKK